jgi:hypothetical protein
VFRVFLGFFKFCLALVGPFRYYIFSRWAPWGVLNGFLIKLLFNQGGLYQKLFISFLLLLLKEGLVRTDQVTLICINNGQCGPLHLQKSALSIYDLFEYSAILFAPFTIVILAEGFLVIHLFIVACGSFVGWRWAAFSVSSGMSEYTHIFLSLVIS